MARTTKQAWPYITGQKGRNRVRAYEDPKTGIIMLEFREPAADGGTRKARVSTKHRDRAEARRQADDLAAALGRGAYPAAEKDGEAARQRPKLTLRTLFDMYLGEVTPGKSRGKQCHDRRTAEMFIRFFGEDREPPTLTIRDWQAFIRERGAGRIRPAVQTSGRGRKKLPESIGKRQIEYDLRLLLAVLNWATLAGDGQGGYLLERNPLKGLRVPKNESPDQPLLFEEEYQAMLAVADEVHPQCRLLFVLLNETGHRGNSVVHLRWSDVDLVQAKVRWRAEFDKQGKGHVTPLTNTAVEELRRARKRFPGVGDAWLFPSARKASEPMRRETALSWFKKAVTLAGVAPRPRLGLHSFKRKAATELDGAPMHTVSELLGTSSQTLMKVYQQPNEHRQREALAARTPVRKAAGS